MKSPSSVNDWVTHVHEIAVSKGWWDNAEGRDPTPDELLAKLMLVVSELSEAVELVRQPDLNLRIGWFMDGKPEGFGVELADAVIRIMDLCGKLGIDLEGRMRIKSEYNETRPRRHGKRV